MNDLNRIELSDLTAPRPLPLVRDSLTIYCPTTGKVVTTLPVGMPFAAAFAEHLLQRIEGAGKHVASLNFDYTTEVEAFLGDYPTESLFDDSPADCVDLP